MVVLCLSPQEKSGCKEQCGGRGQRKARDLERKDGDLGDKWNILGRAGNWEHK